MRAVFPPALKPGDTIAIVMPAGKVDPERIERARRRLVQAGFAVRLPADLTRGHGYLAGADQVRAAELMAALADDGVQAVFPARGGYGVTRILPLLDYDQIRAHPKILTGFSDITALHLAVQKKTGLVTFHSPNPMDGLGLPDGLDSVSARTFWRALGAQHYPRPGGPGRRAGYVMPLGEAERAALGTLGPGVGRGRLTGGNLSLVCALLGTPFEMESRGRVLFLEEVDERPYRIDRFFCQLRLAGKLDGLAGVLLGHFTRCEPQPDEASLSLDQVLRDYVADLGVPVITGFPTGHHRTNVTLPLGAMVELDADRRRLTVLEDPVVVGEHAARIIHESGRTNGEADGDG